jgi:type II secretory pathway pseudopilin PulG
MRKTSEKGFAVLEIIMVIAAIGLLAVVAFFAYQAWQKSHQSNSMTSSSSSQTSTQDEATTALAHVKAFYRAYLAVAATSNQPSTASWTQNGYWTQAAEKQVVAVPGADIPTCSQNPPDFSQYTFSSPIISGAKGTVTVTDNTDYTDKKGPVFDLALAKDNGLWKIDNFKCPTP